MSLNDLARDADRQRLLPFVTRLACADSEDIERQRQAYISFNETRHMSISRGIEILEGALAIGRKADPLALSTAKGRMSAVKETASSIADSSTFEKVHKWLEGFAPAL
jgi:hypothetical protein